MANITHTLKSSVEYSQKGCIEQWVHEFLLGEGGNKAFSDGLKLYERQYLGPLELEFKYMVRCYGPEEDMQFRADKDSFEFRIKNMVTEAKGDWDIPPLIVSYYKGELTINDGNHRFEALKKLGKDRYHVIIWTTSEEDMSEFKQRFNFE
jgi:hypothetical protein